MTGTGRAVGVIMPGLLLAMASCGGEPALEPPEIHYGQAVCDACGMIVSDERFAAAEVVIRGGRAEVRLFDDTGEVFQLDAPVGERYAWYVHDMRSLEWVEARDAVYLRSEDLRTPMALHTAAFGSREAAEAAREEFGGEILSFDQLAAADGPP